jgi:hypothetical protein
MGQGLVQTAQAVRAGKMKLSDVPAAQRKKVEEIMANVPEPVKEGAPVMSGRFAGEKQTFRNVRSF